MLFCRYRDRDEGFPISDFGFWILDFEFRISNFVMGRKLAWYMPVFFIGIALNYANNISNKFCYMGVFSPAHSACSYGESIHDLD